MHKFSFLLALTSRRSFSSGQARLSGHNKWSKIQQKKAVADARRGVVFGKTARDIMVAVRMGGSADPDRNLQLAAVLKKARELDVPRENIEKALAKATRGSQGGSRFIYEAIVFESIGVLVECQTDNNNRTIHNIREIFNEYGGRTTPVKFMFEQRGRVTVVPKGGFDKLDDEIDVVVSHALDNGATDFSDSRENESDPPSLQFVCEPGAVHSLAQSLQEKNSNWTISEAESRYVPLSTDVEASEEAKNALRELIDELEASEDVVQVATSLPGFP